MHHLVMTGFSLVLCVGFALVIHSVIGAPSLHWIVLALPFFVAYGFFIGQGQGEETGDLRSLRETLITVALGAGVLYFPWYLL